LYSGFIVGALASSYPRITRLPPESNKAHVPKQETPRKPTRTEAEGPLDSQRQNQLWFSLWLGALGFSLQSLMEFSLYIPALAWTAFAFLGLISRQKYLPFAGDRPLTPAKQS